MEVLNVLFFICGCLFLVQAQTTYKARVLDYTPKDEGDAKLTPDYNLARIEENAVGSADIVVFPEYGLTTIGVLDKPNFKEYAIVVPEAGETDFCEESKDAYKILNKLSCIAKEKNKYIVVNLLEKDSKKSDVIYNTNVVFDRKGLLLAKYRKINLFGDEINKLTAGTDLVTFKTDFGVHFGLFTCFDILFRKPAIEILNKGVTDIIFPTAWFSEIPHLTALQVQDGYAQKTGVNLLASGYNFPKKGSSGSGIYLANGHKNNVINTLEGTYPVELEVPIISKREDTLACSETRLDSPGQRGIGTPAPIANFYTVNDIHNNYDSYAFEKLNPSETTHTSELCSPDKKMCCNFYAKHPNTWEGKNITYVFAAYSKVDRGCSLLSCNTTDTKSCGIRVEKTDSIVFDEIIIKSTLPETYVIPSTLTYKMYPLNYYKYCSSSSNHEIKGRSLSGLTTFGIYSINSATTITNTVAILVFSCIVSLHIFK